MALSRRRKSVCKSKVQKKHSKHLRSLISRLKESEGARVSTRKSGKKIRPSTKKSKALVKRIKESMGLSTSNRRRKSKKSRA